jgi:ribosomal protein S18 acetylase RimI-like enzyme
VEPRLLNASQVDAASATLGEAFFDDPVLQVAAPDESVRRQQGAWFMGTVVKYGLKWGEVWANEDASAVAVWVPPGSGEMGPGRALQIGMAMLPFRLGLSPTLRLLKLMSMTEKFHKSVYGPHWYLVSIGVRNAAQGQGLGSTLVDMGTSRADAAGLPCYLETGTDSNISYYEKRGFEIVAQEDFDGHTITGMVRQPAARGTIEDVG